MESNRFVTGFFVAGIPKPAGSKRGFAVQKGGVYTGKVAMKDMSGQKGNDWRGDVKSAALIVRPDVPVDEPLEFIVTFYFPRPKCHFGTGRNASILKNSAPRFPIGKPDLTKVTRSIEDALTGIIWKDDATIVEQLVKKRYCDEHRTIPGALVEVWRAE